MSKMKNMYEYFTDYSKALEHINKIQDEGLKNALLYMLDKNNSENYILDNNIYDLTFDFKEENAGEIKRLTKGLDAFAIFNENMAELSANLPDTPSQLVMKMNYAYAVTLMETCLADMLKHSVLTHDVFMDNAVTKITEFKTLKVSLKDIHNDPNYVSSYVMNFLTQILYHKIDLVVSIYRLILDEDYPVQIGDKIGTLMKIAEIRHDIVHRNGFDKEGNEHILTPELVKQAMQDISDFVQNMRMYISDVEKALPF